LSASWTDSQTRVNEYRRADLLPMTLGDGWKALEVNSYARLGRLLGFVICGRIVPPRKLAVEEMG